MKLQFKKGTAAETIQVNDQNVIAVLNPSTLPEGMDENKIINDALDHPIGTKQLEEILVKDGKTVIVISDNTRPCPSYVFLPLLVKRIEKAGISKKNIKIIIARGSHRNCTEEEKKQLVGNEIYQSTPVLNSGEHGYIHIGTTSRQTPVDMDADVVKAQYRILTGNVEFHYFAGFSGGAKALMPGCADPNCIASNHRMMVDDHACAGQLDGNPVREDIEEAAAMIGTDFILNVVLNTHKEIIYAVGGDMKAAHRDACKHLSSLYLSEVKEKADIVIVSQGGYPKDRNLYQTQKALDNAKYAVKDGGTIILIGACEEGFGNSVFAQWLKEYPKPDQLINHLHDHFELGGHKAAAIALVRKKADILLVSDMDETELQNTILKPYDNLSAAYEEALKEQGEQASIIAMPYGGSTLPVIK